eukprot:6184763-Pleurochrysis_carterae.AAC.1
MEKGHYKQNLDIGYHSTSTAHRRAWIYAVPVRPVLLLQKVRPRAQGGSHFLRRRLIKVHGFTQSQFNPCYFFKKYDHEHRMDLILYVDDCSMADTGSNRADEDLRIFRERFKLTMQSKPK